MLKSDLILFPINERNAHWSLMVIDNQREKLIYLNSLQTQPDPLLFPRVRRWLKKACAHVKAHYDNEGMSVSRRASTSVSYYRSERN